MYSLSSQLQTNVRLRTKVSFPNGKCEANPQKRAHDTAEGEAPDSAVVEPTAAKRLPSSGHRWSVSIDFTTELTPSRRLQVGLKASQIRERSAARAFRQQSKVG